MGAGEGSGAGIELVLERLRSRFAGRFLLEKDGVWACRGRVGIGRTGGVCGIDELVLSSKA